jgi:hypothetical protein
MGKIIAYVLVQQRSVSNGVPRTAQWYVAVNSFIHHQCGIAQVLEA